MLRILCLAPHYLPGYRAGGPLRSISNIVALIGGRCEFRIITSDRDLGDLRPYEGVDANNWVALGNAKVFYLKNNFLAIGCVIRSSEFDVIYLNSFFDRCFSMVPVIVWNSFFRGKSRLIIAPRGEFSKGALQIKRRRKSFYILLAKLFGLYRDVIWHASTELEAEDVSRVFGVDLDRIRIAQDVADVSASVHMVDKLSWVGRRHPLKICFISRICRKKNLDYAISVLNEVDVPVVFDVYGPPEDEDYLVRCKDLASKLPPHIVVHFHGPLSHAQVCTAFGRHHLFFFPTLGENYGHVIAEALGAGTPVLLSDQTPWVNLQQRGVGWDLPLSDRGAFARAIRDVAVMDDNAYARMRAKAASHSLGRDASAIEQDMVKLFFE
jgi:glycosyltransferase involved in cell wall biosynthesis